MDAPTRGVWRRWGVAGTRLAWAGIGLLVLTVILLGPRPAGPTRLWLMMAVIIGMLAVLLRRLPLSALVLVLAGSFIITAAGREHVIGTMLGFAADLAVGWLAATRSRPVSIGGAVLAVVVQTGSATFTTRGENAFTWSVGLVVLAVTTAWMIGSTVRERRRHAEELRAQAEARAVTAERLRIARELHDLVAHSISVIAIQAGMGSRVMDTQPAEARKALDTIEAASRETLAELRRTVGALRQSESGSAPGQPMAAGSGTPGSSNPGSGNAGSGNPGSGNPGSGNPGSGNPGSGNPGSVEPGSEPAPRTPAPGLGDLDQLVDSARAAGVELEVRCLGHPRPMPHDIDLSAFRIIQESVTNVVRHAGTDRCLVTIDYRDEELSVEVIDHGRAVPAGEAAVSGQGFGIIGMRERVSLLHGRFSAGPRADGGFQVHAQLPMPAVAR